MQEESGSRACCKFGRCQRLFEEAEICSLSFDDLFQLNNIWKVSSFKKINLRSYLVLLVFFFKNYCSINKRAPELILESYTCKMEKLRCSVGNILIVNLLVEGTKTPWKGVLKSISKSVQSPKLKYTPPKVINSIYTPPPICGEKYLSSPFHGTFLSKI